MNSKLSLKEHLIERKKLNLLALLPCPVKVPIENEFENYLDLRGNELPEISYCIEGNANTQLSYEEYINKYADIDEIPDIVISPGFNGFYHKSFIDRFTSKGYFVDVAEYPHGSFFEDIGYRDPSNAYTMLAMNLSVLVVDHAQLGGADCPKSWGDILKEEFVKKVVIRGQKNFFCETVLLNYYKDYGIEGIRKLGMAVKAGLHPAQMAKLAGSGKPESPAVSVIPYFYARAIVNIDKVSIIWPEDGALVNPITMIVKKSSADKLQDIIRFLAGPQIGQIFGNAFLPSPHPDAVNQLPKDIKEKGIKLKWPGWEFLRTNDVGDIVSTLNEEFTRAYKGMAV